MRDDAATATDREDSSTSSAVADGALPTDLTPDEVCALLDEATVAELLGTDVNGVSPGTSQSDCQWLYTLPDGPATAMQVQVMTMAQTSKRLGAEALEWGLGRAPSGSDVTEIASLDVPNGTYQFGEGTAVFAIDAAGRLFTVSTHAETPEASRIGLVEAVLAALGEQHP